MANTAEMRYDYRNQMVEYEDIALDAPPTRYVYDPFGRRVAQVFNGASLLDPTPPASIRYVYGGQASWQVLQEYAGVSPSAPLWASWVYGNYIDEPIEMLRDFDLGGENPAREFYYHQDELFNVVAITAGEDDTAVPSRGTFDAGEVVERIKYGDYGTPTIMEEDGDVDFNDITVVNTFLAYEYCGTCTEERGAPGGSFAGGGLDFMGIEGDVAAQTAPLPLNEALAALGYNSIGAFVAAISAMSEQARNATIQQLGVLLGGAQ